MKNKSFTLIELLVVIVIIGILAGVIIVSVSSSINKANFAKAQSFSNTVQNELLGDLVSEWTFNSPAVSGKTEDSWGNNDGTLYGANGLPELQTKENCVYGTCYLFDGTDDYIDCGNDAILNFNTKDYSISLFFKRNTFGTVQILIDKRTSEYVGFVLFFGLGNELFFRGDGLGHDFISSKKIEDSNWHHLFFSNDRDEKRIFYIDGVIEESLHDSSSLNIDNVISLKIGKEYNGSHYYFNGSIDDVRIYDSALSTSQIKQQYIAGLNSLLSKNIISQEDYDQRLNNLAQN